MNIPTKFDIGDLCYPVMFHVEEIIEECSVCSGKGSIDIEGYSILCPKCHGVGTILKSGKRTWYTQSVGEIKSMRIEYKSKNPLNITNVYSVYRDRFNITYLERDLFCSEEEARQECKERNGEEVEV